MKQLLTILSLLISSSLFSQVVVKVPQQDISGKVNKSDSGTVYVTPHDISGKVNYTDSNTVYVTPAQLRTKVDTSYKDTLQTVGTVLHVDSISPTLSKLRLNVSTDTTFSNASDDSVSSSLAVKKYARGIVDTVTNIQALENYNGFARVVIVSDTLRGGVFHWIQTAKADSGITFPAYIGGYWRRTWDYLKVNVCWFGAKNDSITDATNGIQAAIDFLDINKGGNGGTVYFPAGTYIVSHTIYLGNKVNLEGTWWSSIQLDNNANCDMFQNPASGDIGYFKISSLRFNGNDPNNSSGTFFHIRYNGYYTSDIYFEHCLIVHFKGDGFNIENGWQYHINNSIIEFIGGAGVRLNPGTDNTGNQHKNIRRVWISNSGIYKAVGDSTSATIDVSGSMNNKWVLGVFITNCNIQNSGAFSPAIQMKGVQDVQIHGNFVTMYPDNSLKNNIDVIKIDSSAIGTITGNNINSWLEYSVNSSAINASAWNKARYGIYVTDSSSYFNISGNQFWHINSDSVHIDSTCNNISRPIISDSLRNNSGVLEMRKNGTFVPQFTLPTGGGGSVGNADSLGGFPASSYYIKTAVDALLAAKANDNTVVHLAGTETITGAKTFAGSAIGSSVVLNLSNTATNSFLGMFQLLSPNMTNGQQQYMAFGKVASNFNRATIAYNHVSDGNTSNFISFGFFGSDNLFNILASGNTGVGTTSPNSKFTVNGSFATAYITKATSYTATVSDYTIEVTATGQTITLPTAVGIAGREYVIKLTVSGSATVATTSSQTIDGSTTYSLSAQYKYVKVQSNGSNWVIIGNN